jgi:hypothetical protein
MIFWGDGMEIIQGYAEYGIFSSLFVSLLLYTLRENEKRENMYREIIKNLSESFKCLADDVCEIKEKLDEMMKK